MKKTLFKNFYRTIFRTFPKFVSIVFMIALGVMVFVGLKITPYIMRGSVDERVKEGNLYDYKISSNFGLQKEDENIISNLKNLKDVEYGYSINLKDEDRKVDFTIENKPEKISTVQVVEGKDIESDSDILLDERLKDKYKIGDEIDFKNVEKFGIFKDEVKKLKQSKFTVKGFIKSPEVLTTLLMGTTENGYLAIVSKDTFDFSYFSYAKITFSDLNGLNRNSKEYKKLSNKRKTELQDSFKGRAGEVYNVIYAQKREALDDSKEEVNKNKFDIKELIHGLMPISFNRYWFMTVYFLLYLLIPNINKYIENLSKEEYKKLLIKFGIILVIPYSIIYKSTAYSIIETYPLSQLPIFALMYLIGGYIKIYGISKLEDIKKYKLIIFNILGYSAFILLLTAIQELEFK